ncbi:hypothetical protein EDB89DRAFT_1911170 [Lactarius sanguifluus]|nr:hypothetical protein EDB89DRAFT_1911170 [Lactarius sanguifluus]
MPTSDEYLPSATQHQPESEPASASESPVSKFGLSPRTLLLPPDQTLAPLLSSPTLLSLPLLEISTLDSLPVALSPDQSFKSSLSVSLPRPCEFKSTPVSAVDVASLSSESPEFSESKSSQGEPIPFLLASPEAPSNAPTSAHSTLLQRPPGLKTVDSVSSPLDITPAFVLSAPRLGCQAQLIYEAPSTLAHLLASMLNISSTIPTFVRKFQSKIEDFGNSQNDAFKTSEPCNISTQQLRLGQLTPRGTRLVFDPGDTTALSLGPEKAFFAVSTYFLHSLALAHTFPCFPAPHAALARDLSDSNPTRFRPRRPLIQSFVPRRSSFDTDAPVTAADRYTTARAPRRPARLFTTLHTPQTLRNLRLFPSVQGQFRVSPEVPTTRHPKTFVSANRRHAAISSPSPRSTPASLIPVPTLDDLIVFDPGGVGFVLELAHEDLATFDKEDGQDLSPPGGVRPIRALGQALGSKVTRALPPSITLATVVLYLLSRTQFYSMIELSAKIIWELFIAKIVSAYKLTVLGHGNWFFGDALRTTEYSLPVHLDKHVELFQPTTAFNRAKGKRTTFCFSPAHNVAPPLSSDNKISVAGFVSQVALQRGRFRPSGRRYTIAITAYSEQFANFADFWAFYEEQVPQALNTCFTSVSVNVRTCLKLELRWKTTLHPRCKHSESNTLSLRVMVMTSKLFGRPNWHNRAVQSFLESLPKGAYAVLFNPAGRDAYGPPLPDRAIPDVSVQADLFRIFLNGGPVLIDTSAAAPSFGAFVALLNDVRLTHGRPSLGFLNIRFYTC